MYAEHLADDSFGIACESAEDLFGLEDGDNEEFVEENDGVPWFDFKYRISVVFSIAELIKEQEAVSNRKYSRFISIMNRIIAALDSCKRNRATEETRDYD